MLGRVFIAMSLDGRIADADGGVEWLAPFDAAEAGYAEFISGVQAVVLGRATFQTVMGFEEWPYSLPVEVMSRGLAPGDVRADLADRVRITADSPAALSARLSVAGVEAAYVDGGGAIRSFLAAGLIGEMTLFIVPVLLGRGPRLFAGEGPAAPLRLAGVRSLEKGMVRLDYQLPP